MIVVNGTTLETPLPEMSAEEREIFWQKQMSERIYRYSSRDVLRFELRLRKNTVQAAKAMSAGRARFATFANARCNPAYWKLTDEGGFLLKPDIRPSEAVEDIFIHSELYAFECAAAIVIVLYKAMLDTIGANLFDRMFQNLYIWSWNYDQDLRLVQHMRGEAFPGDVRYFDNPDVNPTTPELQGENVVVIGDNLYFGHGLGITTGERIIEALNRNRKPWATKSAFLMREIIHPDYEALHRAVTTSTAPRMVKSELLLSTEEILAYIGNKIYIR